MFERALREPRGCRLCPACSGQGTPSDGQSAARRAPRRALAVTIAPTEPPAAQGTGQPPVADRGSRAPRAGRLLRGARSRAAASSSPTSTAPGPRRSRPGRRPWPGAPAAAPTGTGAAAAAGTPPTPAAKAASLIRPTSSSRSSTCSGDLVRNVLRLQRLSRARVGSGPARRACAARSSGPPRTGRPRSHPRDQRRDRWPTSPLPIAAGRIRSDRTGRAEPGRPRLDRRPRLRLRAAGGAGTTCPAGSASSAARRPATAIRRRSSR